MDTPCGSVLAAVRLPWQSAWRWSCGINLGADDLGLL
jgi:hypothetical protein